MFWTQNPNYLGIVEAL